jgi:hypothetical protein
MAEDRANDPARVYPAGGSYEDTLAQRYFSAHGMNKGKAGSMNFRANVEQAFNATSGLARNNRRQHRSNLNVRSATTASQQEKNVN